MPSSIMTTTNGGFAGTVLPGDHQNLILRTPGGLLVALIPAIIGGSTAQYVWYHVFSTDDGATWQNVRGGSLTSYYVGGQFTEISVGLQWDESLSRLWIVETHQSSSTYFYYAWDYDSATQTFTYNTGNYAAQAGKETPAVLLYPTPSGSLQGSSALTATADRDASGSLLTLYLVTNTGSSRTQVSFPYSENLSAKNCTRILSRHTGDGYTPATNQGECAFVWVGRSDGLIYYRRFQWANSASTPVASTKRTLNSGTALVNVGLAGVGSSGDNVRYPFDAKFTGFQYSVAGVYNDGSGHRVRIWERNIGDTSTTTYTAPVLLSYRPFYSLSLGYDTENNLYLYAIISDGAGGTDGAHIKFDRATASFGSWTTVSNSALQFASVSDSGLGDQWVLYGEGSQTNKTWYVDKFVDILQPPRQPVWVTSSKASQVSETLYLEWLFGDPDIGDSQAKYALRRTIAGVVRYWDAGLSSWSVSEVENTSSNTYVTLPSSWASTGDAVYFAVKTIDGSSLASPYSSELLISADTKSNPTITSPASGPYNAVTVTLNWTCADQGSFKAELISVTSGGVIHSSGWVTNSLTRSYVFPNILAVGRDYTLRLTTKTALGLESDAQTVLISVLYDPPEKPGLTVTFHEVGGKNVAIKLAGVADRSYTTSATDIEYYRRVVGSGSTGVLVGTSTNPGTFIDWSVRSGVDYEYKAVSVSSAGGKTDGDWRTHTSSPDLSVIQKALILWDVNSALATNTSLPNLGTGSSNESARLGTFGAVPNVSIALLTPPVSKGLVVNGSGSWYIFHSSTLYPFGSQTIELVARFSHASSSSSSAVDVISFRGINETSPAITLRSVGGNKFKAVARSASGTTFTSSTFSSTAFSAINTPHWVKMVYQPEHPSGYAYFELYRGENPIADEMPTEWVSIGGTIPFGFGETQLDNTGTSTYLLGNYTDPVFTGTPSYAAEFVLYRAIVRIGGATNVFDIFPEEDLRTNNTQLVSVERGSIRYFDLQSPSATSMSTVNVRGIASLRSSTSSTEVGAYVDSTDLSSVDWDNDFSAIFFGARSSSGSTRPVIEQRGTSPSTGVKLDLYNFYTGSSTMTFVYDDGSVTRTETLSSGESGISVESGRSMTVGVHRSSETLSYARGSWDVSVDSKISLLGRYPSFIEIDMLPRNLSHSSTNKIFKASTADGLKYIEVYMQGSSLVFGIVDSSVGLSRYRTTTLSTSRLRRRKYLYFYNGTNIYLWEREDDPDDRWNSTGWKLVDQVAYGSSLFTSQNIAVCSVGNDVTFQRAQTGYPVNGLYKVRMGRYTSIVANFPNTSTNDRCEIDFTTLTPGTTSFTCDSGQTVSSTGTGGEIFSNNDWLSFTILNQNSGQGVINGYSGARTLLTPVDPNIGSLANSADLEVVKAANSKTFMNGFAYYDQALTKDEIIALHEYFHGIE